MSEIISSFETAPKQAEGFSAVNWHTMPPRKPYRIFLGIPNRGDISSGCYNAAIAASRRHTVFSLPMQFGDIEHNFNMLFSEAWNNRFNRKLTHWGLLHTDISAEEWWLDVAIEEMDRVGADVMSVVMAIKDERGLTTTGIRYPGVWGTRRFSMREISRLPETFSIADTDEPDAVLAINTGLWVCRFPQAGWPDKFVDGGGFIAKHAIRIENGNAVPWFDSEDWLFSDWAATNGLRVFATRKIKAVHHGGFPYGNQGSWGSWESERQRPRRPLAASVKARPAPQITIETEKPVAVDSLDHTMPLGAICDNSLSYAFNRKLFGLIPAQLCRVLDLGCSGGGFVRSILEAGGFAIGIEGSDLSLKTRRAEWATIPDYLFTADVTAPFTLKNCTPEPVKFNVITGWEFFEHISDDDPSGFTDIDVVIDNILSHATPDAILICSISANEEPHHRTAKPKDWWVDRIANRSMGTWDFHLDHAPDLEDYFGEDLVRGSHEPGAISQSVVFRCVKHEAATV
jgi:SAM-dependent methyltransferase